VRRRGPRDAVRACHITGQSINPQYPVCVDRGESPRAPVYFGPVNDDIARVSRDERRREWGVFLLLAFGLAPVLAVIIVATYGLGVWIWQMIVGPPGPPPP
jgi:periplasmic nitrate reductase NapE